MIVRPEYTIPPDLYKEALAYASISRAHTSDRHDFHAGGLDNKQKKMFEGKLGEKCIKMLLQENGVWFIEDHSAYYERDEYDFIVRVNGRELKVDVKTRTEHFHIRTLEMVEQAQHHPKDIYISVRLFKDTGAIKIIGWFSLKDLLRINRIENNGYLDNYVMYDSELRPIEELLTYMEKI